MNIKKYSTTLYERSKVIASDNCIEELVIKNSKYSIIRWVGLNKFGINIYKIIRYIK